MPLLWLGPWHGHPLLTLFSQDGFLLFWFSAPTSAGMNVLGGVGPGLSPLPPQNPKCTPTSSPFMGTPPPPHIVVQRFLKKKKKKAEKKKTTSPISRCERNCLPQGLLALGPVSSLDPPSWLLLLPTAPYLSPREEARG